MKTEEEIIQLKKEKIEKLHERENNLNKENNDLDKMILQCYNKKRKIAIAISKLCRYRNNLIDEVFRDSPEQFNS